MDIAPLALFVPLEPCYPRILLSVLIRRPSLHLEHADALGT